MQDLLSGKALSVQWAIDLLNNPHNKVHPEWSYLINQLVDLGFDVGYAYSEMNFEYSIRLRDRSSGNHKLLHSITLSEPPDETSKGVMLAIISAGWMDRGRT